MKKLSSQEIRKTWLNFFHERGHHIEEGASLIPHDDPTLLWINAGVSSLKKYFDGSEVPECKRIVNVQKCIRTNDISNVGKTARHHTFFEMLGNFSIGDYFRKEVIPRAYEILTSEKYFGLDVTKLYATYHPDDKETYELWQKVGLPKDHLIPLEGNFWEIGSGPCGPNTEVFYDRGEKYDPEKLGLKLLEEEIDNDRYIEIWGIVFSQYNAEEGVNRANYKELPHKNIDTGAGLERIASILQGADTNFETDLFMPIIKETEKLSKAPYEGKNLMPYRVIADHIRTCTFALADGADFSNEGRGYVLRRLLRRAMRYGQKINLNEPFLYKLVGTVIDVMKGFYPYLVDKKGMIEKKIKSEEEKFIKTLVVGEKVLHEIVSRAKKLSEKDAFLLYDSYGFPIELTREICEDLNIEVDMQGFNKLLEKQKEQARNSRKVQQSFNKQSEDLLNFKDESIYINDAKEISAKVIGTFKNGVKVDVIEDEGEVAFDTTNFYAEKGGQVADAGTIENKRTIAQVLDVSSAPNKQHLHHVKVEKGTIKIGDKFTLKVDQIRHNDIIKNHSATHLLQSALMEVLGEEVRQKGSFVCDKYLRFDFNFDRKLTLEEIETIEEKVNEFIQLAIPRVTQELPIKEALKLGAIAEFGEKYGQIVRVVSFGKVSTEFCGGSHVLNSSEIGLFVIHSEESISSGVRRITALTGIEAYRYLKEREKALLKVKALVNAPNFLDVQKKVMELFDINKVLNKKIEEYKQKTLQNLAKTLKTEFIEIAAHKVLLHKFTDMDRNDVMFILDEVKNNLDNYCIIFVGEKEGKKSLMVACGKYQLERGIKANELLKTITTRYGGNGGGRADIAQGSIVNEKDLIVDVIKELL